MIYAQRVSNIEYAGYWVMPGGDKEGHKIKFSARSKPRLRHRFFMQFLMGWKWEDA